MAILLELQGHGELRAEDLAETFEVSIRTIYRDVQALSEGGVPVVATPGKGYRLMEGYFLPPLSFTAAEAALLMLGGEYVHGRVDADLQRSAEGALRKLAGVLPAEQQREVESWRGSLNFFGSNRSGLGLSPALLHQAIQGRRVLRLLYHTYQRSAPEERDVEPITLCFMGDVWHLAAYCRLRQAHRFFRLDRIDAISLLDESFTLGPRHVTSRDWETERGRHPEARVRFDHAVMRWVRERQPWVFLREEPGQSGVICIYALRNERELLSWLLTWGSAFEVLEPADFRLTVAAECQRMLARHQTAPNHEKIGKTAAAADSTLSGAPG